MKRNPKTTALAIFLSVALGSIATTLTSGCQSSTTDNAASDIAPPTIDKGTVSDTPGAEPSKAADDTSSEKSGAEPTAKPADDAGSKDAPAENKTPATKEATEKDSTDKEPADKEPADKEPADKEPADKEPKTEKPADADKPSTDKPSTSDGAGAAPLADATAVALAKIPIDKAANAPIKPGDWAQWGGTTFRNNTPVGQNIASNWTPGDFDRKTGNWVKDSAEGVKWVSQLGSQSYGNPVIANGQAYVGTNNGSGYLKRYPIDVDLGCLLCFRDTDGKFLWQHSSEKLPTGRVHDWPQQGICCAPYCEGNRLWFVTSRGEVRCLDTEGFYDNEDDGPVLKDTAKLFEIMKAEDPAADQVAGFVKQLDDSKIPDALKAKFAAAGYELPANAEIKVDAAGKKWTITASANDIVATFPIVLQGPRLVGAKILGTEDKLEADVVWVYDMMTTQRVSQHNMCSCSVTAWGDILFVCTSNGVDESHVNIPSPDAPSFMAMNKHTGEVYWTDASPGINIHHGQWSSPTVAELGGVPQVLFGGGDGWLYSFRADQGKDGKPEFLWKFDCNPKEAKLILGGRGTRNDIIGTPVVYDGLVYVAVGQDPEHGEGIGHLYCIDPTKRGDTSPYLAVQVADRNKIVPYRRDQAVIPEKGEIAIDNPNSAVIWHYSEQDRNGDGTIDFEETMHRTCGTVAIKNDLLFVADFSGLFHCVDAKTGKVHWTNDMLAAAWGSPLIVDGHVYIGDEDGDISIFNLTAEAHEPIQVINMGNSVYSTPIVANNTLYIANKTHLFAIEGTKE